jgi:hypothetical protein
MCRSEYAKIRYINGREHINKVNAKWKTENADKHRNLNNLYRVNNTGKIKESSRCYYLKNRNERRKTNREWYQGNSGSVIKRTTEWKKSHPEATKIIRLRSYRKTYNTPKGRINSIMSSGVGFSLKGNKNGRHWEDLVRYTVADLKTHLERLFQPGMSWDNYGTVWEIDHKIPKSLFCYEHPEDIDFHKAWGLQNLQPLWVSVNRKKYNKLQEPFQPSLLLREVING